jgi:hypothetical protein
MPTPSYVPVIATGRDVEFAEVQVTGAAVLEDNLTVQGYSAFAAGQFDGQLNLWSGAKDTLRLGTAGGGLAVAEGTGATSGVVTLVAGSATVATNKVAADSRIQLTVQSLGTVTTPKAVGVTARVAGGNFTVTSADATDTSTVAWLIVSPAA